MLTIRNVLQKQEPLIQKAQIKKGVVDLRNKKQAWEFFINKGWIDNNKFEIRRFDGIHNAWKDEPCYVVGCGTSLNGFDFHKLDGQHTIGINHVVEDYDGFEWFCFLDRRFLQRTTYDLSKFQGKIIAQNNTGLKANERTILFKTRYGEPTNNIEDGLFNGNLTGLCALHLAILSGANPIYLLGIDCGGGTFDNYHYKKNYTGEIVHEDGIKKLKKYEGTARYFDHFKPWANKIINLSSISKIGTFVKENIKEHFRNNVDRYEISQSPKICHVIGMDNMEQMGDISRHVFNQCYGEHIFTNIKNPNPPKADVYLLECFSNNSALYINYKKPHRWAKVISLIHSSGNCYPAKLSNRVICLTETWKKIFERQGILNCEVINGCIDLNIFGNPEPDYAMHTFGRITRTGTSKIHPKYYTMVQHILEKDALAKCIMYTSNPESIPMLKHPRMIYDKSIKINETEKKAAKLRELSLYVHIHGNCQEVFSMAIAEAMATGLVCIVNEKQDSMKEQLGGTGIFVPSIEEAEKVILELLPDMERKKEMGQLARKKAQEYGINKMVKSYDKIIKEVLNEH